MVILTTFIAALGSVLSYFFDWGMTGTSTFILIAAIINIVSYFYSDKIVLRATGAKLLTKEKAPDLFNIVETLCEKSELPMPALYLLEEKTMNAFATGRNYKNSAVAVSRGLLERMTRDEVEGVVSHELSHIRNFDMRFSAIVSVLVGFISLIADMYWSSRIASQAGDRDRSGIIAIIGIIMAVLAPLSAMFIQMAVSRKRELLADASGAHLCQKPKALASALKKIALDARLPAHMSSATAHLYFSVPNKDTFIDKLFSTHPPIEDRIKILENI
jgi:heat shock protein HtpX